MPELVAAFEDTDGERFVGRVEKRDEEPGNSALTWILNSGVTDDLAAEERLDTLCSTILFLSGFLQGPVVEKLAACLTSLKTLAATKKSVLEDLKEECLASRASSAGEGVKKDNILDNLPKLTDFVDGVEVQRRKFTFRLNRSMTRPWDDKSVLVTDTSTSLTPPHGPPTLDSPFNEYQIEADCAASRFLRLLPINRATR